VPELDKPKKAKSPETLPFNFGPPSSEHEDRVKQLQTLGKSAQRNARQASLDPDDGIAL
jgi:hypothetical protein